MLRLAPALLVLLAGCTGVIDGDGSVSQDQQTASAPIIMIVNHDDETYTFQVEVLQTDRSPAPRQVYQAVQHGEYRTPPANMDPPCGEYPQALRATIFHAITGHEVARREVPFACGPDEFFMGSEESTVYIVPTAGQFTMPATWNRGEPWPFDGDPADEERGQGEKQPAIAWSVSQADVSATVTSADPGANWANYEMRFDRSGRLDQHGKYTQTMPAGTFVTLGSASIGGGDTLRFCITGGTGPLKATLRHIESNAIARDFVFNNAGSC